MRELKNIADECITELKSMGIKCGKVRKWEINNRAKCRLGQCVRVSIGVFDISIAGFLLDENTDIFLLKNTVIHELLHTVKGCFKHTGKWKLLAEMVNENYPQYNVKRTFDRAVIADIADIKEPTYRYILKCKNCGLEIKRQRKSKAVINYKNYRCGKCGGNLERIK